MTPRTTAALKAIHAELDRRRALIDSDDDLVSLTVVVKFERKTTVVRGTVYTDERLTRTTDHASLGTRERAEVRRAPGLLPRGPAG